MQLLWEHITWGLQGGQRRLSRGSDVSTETCRMSLSRGKGIEWEERVSEVFIPK